MDYNIKISTEYCTDPSEYSHDIIVFVDMLSILLSSQDVKSVNITLWVVNEGQDMKIDNHDTSKTLFFDRAKSFVVSREGLKPAINVEFEGQRIVYIKGSITRDLVRVSPKEIKKELHEKVTLGYFLLHYLNIPVLTNEDFTILKRDCPYDFKIQLNDKQINVEIVQLGDSIEQSSKMRNVHRKAKEEMEHIGQKHSLDNFTVFIRDHNISTQSIKEELKNLKLEISNDYLSYYTEEERKAMLNRLPKEKGKIVATMTIDEDLQMMIKKAINKKESKNYPFDEGMILLIDNKNSYPISYIYNQLNKIDFSHSKFESIFLISSESYPQISDTDHVFIMKLK